MNLKRIFAWDRAGFESGQEEHNAPSIAEQESNDTAKVVFMSNRPEVSNPDLNPITDMPTLAQPSFNKGLMYEPELVSYFSRNYFGLGRHSGMLLKSAESLGLGRAELISNFQNGCAAVLERKFAKINKLRSEIVAIDGLSPPTTKRLELACEHLMREIEQLEHQMSSAMEGKGWVLEALNRYQMGFQKGMREAIEFELMAG